MKKLLCFCSGMMFCLTVNADFCATNLPSLVGEYNCSYFSTNNLNVPAMLTLTTNSGGGLTPPGLGPVWDFSQPQQSQETILRTDIIAPANGMDGGSFSDAAYAEQDTSETLTSTNQIAWRYYSITNQGRLYYGSYVPNTSADGLAVFQPPTLDIPVTVTNGQTWSRSTSWNSTVYGFPIYYEFSDTSTVDAQGTLILPNLGPLPALRVHEIHSYTGLLDGYPYEIVTNQYYYWLVPNLGVAAQITIYGNNIVDGETPPFTNSVERMYYASYYTNPLPITYNFAPDNLHIQSQNGAIALNWIPLTNSINNLVSTNYQVQAISSLSGTNWQVLGLTSGTNWSDALSPTQRFYRVVGFP
jgi:hypothetical protein